MTPTISPVTGALPSQPAPSAASCAAVPPPPQGSTSIPAPQDPQAIAGASAMTTVAPSSATGGGLVQAAQGAMVVSPEQLIPAIQGVVASITNLVAAIQQGGITGGGAPGRVPEQVALQRGANAAPSAADTQRSPDMPRGPSAADDSSANAGLVDPSTVKDKTGTGGMSAAAMRGLEAAHRYGLPLVSGKRTGNGTSDHDSGNAIDVGALPIGAAPSNGGTSSMRAYAEYMREQGKAGKLDVKYVIRDGQIASASNDWAWRDYDVPGKSDAAMAALKSSNPGEYNRLEHNDHVHVSFG